MSEHKVNERERPDRIARLVDAAPEDFAAGCCGSCYWRRTRVQFGNIVQACVVMPKQVMAVTRGAGVQIIALNPVIENLTDELCAMWKPLQGDTQRRPKPLRSRWENE